MLTATQLVAREGRLTASRVSALMTGDENKIMDLWREMIGDPLFKPADLSGVWPVRLGEATEALNLEWYGRKHGKVTRMGEVVLGNPDWMAATLDGWDDAKGCPVECKNVGGREPLETIIARYQPQIHWQMMVTGATQCALSVIMGANEPIVEMLTLDNEYAKELMRRAEQFMRLVETLVCPVALPPVTPPIVAERIISMDGNEEWKRHAEQWIQTEGAVFAAKTAEASLKKMVPADVAKATGYGVVISKNRAGAMSLRKIAS
jgi:hypothetical protein